MKKQSSGSSEISEISDKNINNTDYDYELNKQLGLS
mgnify:CR=1 FL=1